MVIIGKCTYVLSMKSYFLHFQIFRSQQIKHSRKQQYTLFVNKAIGVPLILLGCIKKYKNVKDVGYL